MNDNSCLLFLPELVPLMSTNANIDLNAFLPKSRVQAVAENGNLDCLRQYLLFKFYNSLETITTKTIDKGNNNQPDNNNQQVVGAFPQSSGLPTVITQDNIAQPLQVDAVQGEEVQGEPVQGQVVQAQVLKGNVKSFNLKVNDTKNNITTDIGNFANLSSKNGESVSNFLKNNYEYNKNISLGSDTASKNINLDNGLIAIITRVSQ